MTRFSWTEPRWHLVPIVIGVALIIWYLEATSRPDSRATARQRIEFLIGTIVFVITFSWPIADLARTTSLLAVVFQRQLTILCIAPLWILGLPAAVSARLSRPAVLDTIGASLSRPVPAIVLTTALLGLTGLPISVDAASHHLWAYVIMSALVLVAGLVLWLPVLTPVPGVAHLSDMGKGGYLIVQSVAPTFLSFAWILAVHPLYRSLHGQHAILGISALLDQQLSGYLAKLGTFGVLWTVAAVLFLRGSTDEKDDDEPTLHWLDVERALERAERSDHRSAGTD